MRKDKDKLKQCAWCKKVKNTDTGIWKEAADIIQGLSHTVCPECKKQLLKNYYLETCETGKRIS